MSLPRRVDIGRPLPDGAFPGGSFNVLVDDYHARHGETRTARGAKASAPSHLAVSVKNTTGATRSRFEIVKLGDSLRDPTSDAKIVNRGITLKAELPDDDAPFAVLAGPAAVGKHTTAVVVGLTWVQVNVTDEAHTKAASVENDAVKLLSGTDGVPIIWKPAGTGVKWCVIRLGVDPVAGIVLGTTTAAWTGTGGSIDVTAIWQGADDVSVSDEIDVNDPGFQFDADLGGYVLAFRPVGSDTWYAVQVECPTT